MGEKGTFQNFARILEINRVLKKHGLRKYFFKEITDLEGFSRRLRLAFQELGAFFIKVGQFLSIEYVNYPEVFRREMEKLQDGAPSFPFSKAKAIIEKEFGKKLSDMFIKIEEEPIAAASLAQVYRAKLHTGEIVVVKVQRPDAQEIFEKDLSVLAWFARRLRKKFKKHNMDIESLMKDLKDFLNAELDFEQEAIHNDLFKRQELSKYEKVPKVFFHTQKVLIEEFIPGLKISDVQAIHKKGIDKEKVINNLSKSMLYHMFVDGLFHGDPHPANILVMPDGRIGYIDFGVLGRFSPKVRKSYVRQYRYVLDHNLEGFINEHLDLSGYNKDNIKNYKKMKKEIESLFNEYSSKSGTHAFDYISKANMVFNKYGVPNNNELVIMLRGFLAINNILKKYGMTDKRFEDLIKVLANLDSIPFAQQLGPEIMEVDFKKRAQAASMVGGMHSFVEAGRVAEMHEKMGMMEKRMSEKDSGGNTHKITSQLILSALIGGTVFFYNRIVSIFSGKEIIVQGMLGLFIIFLLFSFFSKSK